MNRLFNKYNNLGMKTTVLISLLILYLVVADNARHRLKKSMKTGLRIKKSSLKMKKSAIKMKKM